MTLTNTMNMKATTIIVQTLITALLLSGCKKENNERILFDAESDQELDRLHWQCKTMFFISSEHVTHGSHSLKMELYPSDYPGVSFRLSSRDWRGYNTLAFDIYNHHETETTLTIRIDDHKDANNYADRFNKNVVLHPGQNRIRIPLSSVVTSGSKKPLNLKTITSLVLFISSPMQRRILNLDYLRLED